jgi:hypothetical protein
MYTENKQCPLLLSSIILMCFSLLGCYSINTPPQLPVSVSIATPSLSLTQTSMPATYPALRLTPVTYVPPSPPANIPLTWTPLPTYSSEEAMTEVRKLYENATCNLPCWWGIVPGKTNWNEAWQFLGRFSTNSKPCQLSLVENKDMPGYIPFIAYLKVPNENPSLPGELALLIKADTFTVEYINVKELNTKPYTISNLFSKYGQPENIYIFGGNTQAGRRYTLYLYYPAHGFISAYESSMVVEEGSDNSWKVCFRESANLTVWSENKYMTINDMANSLPNAVPSLDSIVVKYFRSIEAVSQTTISAFYKTFVASNKQPCITILQK